MSSDEEAEFARQFRVLDQSLTAYSFLRDKFVWCATAVEILILGTSAVLLGLTSFTPELLSRLGVERPASRLTLSLLSTVLFALGAIQWKVDWAEKGRAFGRAAEELATLKHEFRAASTTGDAALRRDVMKRYAALTASLVPIPQRAFLKTKLVHRRKVELSKLASRRPGLPLILLRVWLFARSAHRDSEG